MGRKPKVRDVKQSELASYDLAFTARIAQVLAQGDNSLQTGKILEKLIDSFTKTGPGRCITKDILVWFESMSVKQQWRFFMEYMKCFSAQLSNIFININKEDPLKGLNLHDRADFIALLFGFDDFEDYAIWLRRRFICSLEKLSRGKNTDDKMSPGIEGLFTDDTKKNLELFDLLVRSAGGESLVDIIDSTAVSLRKQTDSLLALIFAVEMVEKKYKWMTPGIESGFRLFWERQKPKLVGRISADSTLKLPGTHVISGIGPYPEEMIFLQEAVCDELLSRVSQDPIKVFQDSLEGKLVNSLVTAIINDLRDQIKRLIAEKRDIRKEELFSSLEDDSQDDSGVDIVLGPKMKLSKRDQRVLKVPGVEDPLIDVYFEELIATLENDEKKVITMLFKDEMTGEQIAKKLNKSAAWVTKTKNTVLKKLSKEIKDNRDISSK
jgi:hypothetical protein